MKLKINSLNKSFESLNVLNDLSYTFEKGRIYTILGKNGSGKTTLFNCIAGFLPYESGTILDEENNELLMKDVGLVHTDVYLPDFLTAYEFLLFFVDIHKDLNLKREDIDTLLNDIGFTTDDRHRLIKDYSSGMKHKLQILTVLLSKPKILLLDEPLTSFDLIASMEMKKLLLTLKKESIMIVSTHILQIAKDLSDEILILNHGQLKPTDHLSLSDEEIEEKVLEMLND